MNNLPGSLLLIAFFIGAILFSIHFARLGFRHRSILMASLAGRWKGRVRTGWFWQGDRIEIDIDGVPGLVDFSEAGEMATPGGWTRVRFAWRSDRRLRLTPESFASRIRRLLGGAELKFDDPFFDDRFWVESSHPTWARSILDPGLRRSLLRLRQAPPSDVTLDIGPSGMMLRAARVLVDDAASLGSLIELAIAILRKTRGLADEAGVVLEPVRAREGSACPVCGQPVADAHLRCPTCRTPHHADCWRYVGGCAIFGCRTRIR